MTKYLLLWDGEGASDAAIHAWNEVKALESVHGTLFLEANTREEWDRYIEQLLLDGWKLQGIGSGSFTHLATLVKETDL